MGLIDHLKLTPSLKEQKSLTMLLSSSTNTPLLCAVLLINHKLQLLTERDQRFHLMMLLLKHLLLADLQLLLITTLSMLATVFLSRLVTLTTKLELSMDSQVLDMPSQLSPLKKSQIVLEQPLLILHLLMFTSYRRVQLKLLNALDVVTVIPITDNVNALLDTQVTTVLSKMHSPFK